MAEDPNPLLEKLGYPSDARLVIFHADDVGMCHGSNQAYIDLMSAGILKTGSVMVPCPWSTELIAHVAKQPHLDLGVHLTLNSEWTGYRWGPITTRDPASGLIDDSGNFWHRPPMTRPHMNLAAAAAEFRAQIELVVRAGIDFTHIDNHMGIAFFPELFTHYVEFGFEYQVPVLVIRHIDDYATSLGFGGHDAAEWAQFVRTLEARGMPLVDHFRITPGYHVTDAEGGRAPLYERMLHDLPAGITYFSLHPNAPGDIETIGPDRAFWRTFEYQYLQSDRLRHFLEAERIVPIGCRELRDVMRGV